MRRTLRLVAAALLAAVILPPVLLTGPMALAEPIQPDFPQTLPTTPPKPGAPEAKKGPVVTILGARCVAAAVSEDTGTSDTYLYREYFEPAHGPRRRDGMAIPGPAPACPEDAVNEAARNALIACRERASIPADCVYGDMDHTFLVTTDVSDSSAEHSVCLAIDARFLGIACTPSAGIDICSVACGQDEAAALEAAKERCKATHNTDCTLSNAVEIAPPGILRTATKPVPAPVAAGAAKVDPSAKSAHPRPVRTLPDRTP